MPLLSTIAKLIVASTPVDLVVTVDGKRIDPTSTFTVTPGTSSTATVVVSKAGFQPQAFKAELRAGATTRIPVKLAPAATVRPAIGGASAGSRGSSAVDGYPAKASSSTGNKAGSKKSAKANARNYEKLGIEIVFVPSGEFVMGTLGTNVPRRTVNLDAYLIGKTPLTVGQFKSYCLAAGIDFAKFETPPGGWQDDHPMVNVTWQQAHAFCKWAGGELPTEAQWEKAARGTDGRRYPWGNEDDPKAYPPRNAFAAGQTFAVGSFPSGASPYGCLDMMAIEEMCLDVFDLGYGFSPRHVGRFSILFRGDIEDGIADPHHGFRLSARP